MTHDGSRAKRRASVCVRPPHAMTISSPILYHPIPPHPIPSHRIPPHPIPSPPHPILQVRAALHQREPRMRVHRHQPRRRHPPHRRAGATPRATRREPPRVVGCPRLGCGALTHPPRVYAYTGRCCALAHTHVLTARCVSCCAGVGGQRRDGGRHQGLHGPRAHPRGQAVAADDRLHRREVRLS
jgi:hypothetical protein